MSLGAPLSIDKIFTVFADVTFCYLFFAFFTTVIIPVMGACVVTVYIFTRDGC
jgi:hypothetical protein